MSHEDIFRARVLASRYEQLKTLLATGVTVLGFCAVAISVHLL
ncbi:hypothetical protein [uncultured Selenomonas sp.]|nr:hypothetical protein [uncultured Selenomonas sp.]